eukprot:g28566.t1
MGYLEGVPIATGENCSREQFDVSSVYFTCNFCGHKFKADPKVNVIHPKSFPFFTVDIPPPLDLEKF